jgi:menaquinone-9 beta-reductase
MRRITIIGGGLAGLTLGIGLRQRSVPVTIWEAGHYPRHRVCGEFISGRGQETLARLGLDAKLTGVGAIPARTTAFFSPRAKSTIRELRQPALSVSRHALDALLADEFRQLGGELRENTHWRAGEYTQGIVRATGRRLQPVVGAWRWFALKVHARNVQLCADLELHLSPEGYVGISWLKGGQVNICGLFRRPAAGGQAPLRWPEVLRGASGSYRHERLARAEFDKDSFCSVAGLSLQPRRAIQSTECCVGDAVTMIAPATGNGMSMAFESAELAIEPLAAYSRGEASWEEAQQTLARLCDERFARRLVWARVLQQVLFLAPCQNAVVKLVPRWRRLWRLLFDRTR